MVWDVDIQTIDVNNMKSCFNAKSIFDLTFVKLQLQSILLQ